MVAYFNTDHLPIHLRPYILLFFDFIHESPIRYSDGTYIPYEKVVEGLEEDLLNYYLEVGGGCFFENVCSGYPQTIRLDIEVEKRKYKRGAKWMIDLLRNTEFNVERLRSCTTRRLNDLAEAKRDGISISYQQLEAMLFISNSNSHFCSIVQQEIFLKNLLKQLDNEIDAKKIFDDLKMFRNEIVNSKRMGLYIAADWKKLIETENENIYSVWNDLVEPNDKYNQNEFQRPTPDYLVYKDHPTENQILTLGSMESSCLLLAVPCNITFDHELYVPLLLFIGYITNGDGPMWHAIRKNGLSYHYKIKFNLHSRSLEFLLQYCTNLPCAYEQFKNVIDTQISENAEWNEILLESAKRKLITHWIGHESYIYNIVHHNFISKYFQQQNSINDVNRSKIKRLNTVTLKQLKRAGKELLTQFFTSNARFSIVCHPNKSSEILEEFTRYFYL